MNGDLPSTTLQWFVQIICLVGGLWGLSFGLWCVWGVIAKEEFIDEYRPWSEIVVRAVAFVGVFLFVGLCVIGLHRCQAIY